MRKIIVGAFVSIDGVMQGPGAPDEDRSGGFELGGWTVSRFDETVATAMGAFLEPPFDLLLGRRTYDIFRVYWPEAARRGDPMGQRFDAINKYVATHDEAAVLGWQNSKWLGRDVVASLRALKRQKGRDLVTQGSTELVQTLFEHDLVDELMTLTFPVILGKGKRLFVPGAAPSGMALLDSSVSPSGVVISRYARAGGVEQGTFALG